MKLEYLENVNEYNDNIIRLFDFNSIETQNLIQNINDVIISKNEFIDFSQFSFVNSINCNLLFRISNNDIGITKENNQIFNCDLTIESYIEMTNLLKPFCDNEIFTYQSYQWLYDILNPIDLLYSVDGRW